MIKIKIMMWTAWHMPRWLVYWCAIRLMAHATGKEEYGNEIVPDLRLMTALDRWAVK